MKLLCRLIFGVLFSTTVFAYHYNDQNVGPNEEPKYCVAKSVWQAIIGNGKCVTQKEAKLRNYNDDVILGSAAAPDSDLEEAHAALDKASTQVTDLETQVAADQAAISKLGNDGKKVSQERISGDDQTRLNAHEAAAKSLQASLEERQQKIRAHEEAVRAKEESLKAAKAAADLAKASVEEARKKDALKIEAQTSGLLTRLDVLKFRLKTGEESLAQIEKGLDNTLLEAYVVAKLSKVAGNLCEAQKKCDKPDEAAKSLLKGLNQEKVLSSLKAPEATGSAK